MKDVELKVATLVYNSFAQGSFVAVYVAIEGGHMSSRSP
eukprot:CAMPEP_0177685626 /NCGR_PEP_ID=MMETSP0447-20121125/33134_1 /TAXON_ID=0 /ORGANISM="Stygamoeba regulata, Strain BSH-02190019" /LENGTH=38 /DNA_ID= /DNA_START= /DNA_END= /DNA_ORIENTATION=